ncbi:MULTISPECIES: LysR family transcriptional regulator [Paraburkholderia]|uniref:DNA-binding transcriptional regulator, LysR family n=1 Tax=Paraburkholderia phenazinium TaxID=60549 RepID=A0A1N6HZU0_9BURK|nr:LysR family transcriptional regulator [Paraburkholderia phenazinium]SIO25155.1 DNA-binding transcriptional regulator, LysR family [Paraburkholderia phenazinium]
MNLAGVDLNLLLVFDALMIERSVTRAASRVCLSQPAASAALGRLRHLMNDELFVRHADGMHPTQRALELEGPLRRALLQINEALEPQTFTPSKSSHSYRIAFNDLGAAMMMPLLTSRLAHLAPNIGVVVEHADGNHAISRVEGGKVDMAMGLFDASGVAYDFEKLYDIPFSCAMRFNHPLIGKSISVDDFCATPQLAIAHDGGASTMLDRQLIALGKRRRLAFTVPHFLSGLFALSNSDLIAVLPSKLIRRFGAAAGIRAVDMPFTRIHTTCGLIWNTQNAPSPPNKWMRSVLRDICSEYHLDRWEVVVAGTATTN